MDRNMRYKIPIVYYHSIADTPLSVKVDNFKNQMQYLKNNNFTTILCKDLINESYNKTDKNIVITFDDCFLDVYENALPVLKEYGFVATFFATMGYDDITLWGSEKEQRWNEEKTDSFNIPYRFMNKLHRKELFELGMEIGSHTINHYNLNELDKDKIDYELLESKKLLEDELGIECESFCYPRGRYDESVINIVKKYYKNACITQRGYYENSKSKYEILRFGIGNDNNYFYEVVDNNIFNFRHRVIKKIKRILGIIK
jgi:peptidoglycan/xylan/chitin deacetylase (PgdA/CDA1 family)